MLPSKPDYPRPQSWVISLSRLYMPAHILLLKLRLLRFSGCGLDFVKELLLLRF